MRLPIHSGAILVNREGFWAQDDVDRSVAEVRGDGTRPLQVSLGKFWTATRHRPHLARTLDLLALGSATWNLRQTFDEALRGTRDASGRVDCGARSHRGREMRMVPSDRVWFDAAASWPLPALPIPVAKEPDARDATSRRQDICEERSRATDPSSIDAPVLRAFVGQMTRCQLE